MELPEGIRITTDTLLQGSILFGLIDLAFLVVLILLVRPERFTGLGRILPAVTAVFWLGVWLWAFAFAWDSIYAYLFPAWSRWIVPPVQALLTGGVAWLAFRLARVWRRAPALVYCLLGGVWGILSHTLAVFLGIVSKPPPLQGASPLAAVGFAFFEFTLYFCVIVLISTLIQFAGRQIHPDRRIHSGA
jgi:hypothetical protein